MDAQTRIFDVIIIGAGVAGCCAARELSRLNVDIAVLEAATDIASGATRANSGIVHAGFDPVPGTLKAHYNVAGSKLYPQWARELEFPLINNGSLVVAFTPEELNAIHALVQRGHENGVEGVTFLGADELHYKEPNLSPDAIGALFAPTSAIADPYAVAQAAAENAIANGARFFFETPVETLSRSDGGFDIATQAGETFHARAVVNAAGVFSDKINNMVSGRTLHITPCRGDYSLFDAGFGAKFGCTVFQAPTAAGKGVLVSRTVHGNLIVGPSSTVQESKTDVATSEKDLAANLETARRTWPDLDTRGIITNYAGIRACGDSRDFIIGQPDDAPGFFNIACLDSPGLTAAPAIAADIAAGVRDYLDAKPNLSFNPRRHAQKLFALAADDADAASKLIAEDPLHGNIVCRCCNVTEADIVQALHAPLPVLCLDTLKWRVGAMMGRCHAGFCTPEILRIFVRETGTKPQEVEKRLCGSTLIADARRDYTRLVEQEASTPSSAVNTKPVGSKTAGITSTGDTADIAPYDVVVVGGGAAGIAAAASARKQGAERVLLIDRDRHLGGILQQCIHSGFGLHRFKEELTGPEYAAREVDALDDADVACLMDAAVLRIDAAGDDGFHRIVCVDEAGEHTIPTRSVVLATGSRERGLGALNMPGARPSGVFSAGSAQNLMNLQGCLPGKRVIILGSGDIGLIMARRLVMAGASVLGVYEIMADPSGLRRNIVQCLEDFDIPLHLSTTVVKLEGTGRLSAVVTQRVDARTRKPLPGTQQRVECDTLLLSVGLLPENEIAKTAGIQLDPVTGGAIVDDALQTSVPDIFACGNALHIHDLVDHASSEGQRAGKSAARAVAAAETTRGTLEISPDQGVRSVVPQLIRASQGRTQDLTLLLRVTHRQENPRFAIEGIDNQGNVHAIRTARALVAVPAEMIQINLRSFNATGLRSLRVRMFAKEDES